MNKYDDKPESVNSINEKWQSAEIYPRKKQGKRSR